jgi:hypothetical protein
MDFPEDEFTDAPGINWQIVMLVAGLALAITAATYAGTLDSDPAPSRRIASGSAPAAPAQPEAQAFVTAAAPMPDFTLYIVPSDAYKSLLEQCLAEYDHSALAEGSLVLGRYTIFVIEPGDRDGDHLYATLLGDQREFGTFEIVDLRDVSREHT